MSVLDEEEREWGGIRERAEGPRNNESCKLARTRGERKGRDVGPKGVKWKK